jgi:DNA gyrase/topoisomerase IV subunit A
MFTCLKRNDKREVKVAQLAGSVGEMSAYHHGEMSLMGTIINLAQVRETILVLRAMVLELHSYVCI